MEFKETEKLLREFEEDFKELDEMSEQLTLLYRSMKEELNQLEKEMFFPGKPKRTAELKLEISEIERELAKVKVKRQKKEVSGQRLINIASQMAVEARERYKESVIQELENRMLEFESFLISAKRASNELSNELIVSLKRISKYCSDEAKNDIPHAFLYYKPYDAVSNELAKFKRKI